MDRRCGERVLAGSRDHRDTPRTNRRIGDQSLDHRRRAEDLERELRHPVAELAEVEVLEDDIGRSPERRRLARAKVRLDRRIGQLVEVTGINPHTKIDRRDLLAIRPDPPDMADCALAQRNRQADRIGIGLGRRLWSGALATAGLLDMLDERTGPDDLTTDPRPTIEPRDWRTLRSPGDAEPVDPTGLDRGRARTEQPLIDNPPEGRADRPANDHRRQAENAATDRGADGRTDGTKNDRCHETILFWGTGTPPRHGAPRGQKAATRQRRAGRRRE